MITLTSATSTLEIRNPRLGNKDVATRNRISKRSKGGDTILFVHPQWPRQRELSLEFDTLTLEEVTALRDFVKGSLGLSVTLIDHEEREWVGIISSPDLEIKEDRDDCDYSTSLTFLVIP